MDNVCMCVEGVEPKVKKWMGLDERDSVEKKNDFPNPNCHGALNFISLESSTIST